MKIIKKILKNKSYRNAGIVLLITTLLATICEVRSLSESGEKEINQITRGEQGSLIDEETLYIKFPEEIETKPIKIQVDPLEYSEIEISNKWEELDNKLDFIVLGENENVENISKKLVFNEAIDGYPFILTYYPENEDYLSKDGTIGLAVPENGIEVKVLIKAKCLSPLFSAEKEMKFKVFNPNEMEGYFYRLSEYINEYAIETKDKKEIPLPDEFEGKSILWEKKVDNNAGPILIVGIVAALALIVGKKEEEEKEKKRVISEMERAYPEIISRLAMYMGAGMTVSAAFRRIGEVYEKRDDSNPLRQEIIKTKREMESGISEIDALKVLAERCKLPQMSKLSSLIIQGSRRGTYGLKDSLKEETKDALQERKNNALRMGEKAGTKLLVPMILMLIMVMAIIMIPAFASFGI